MVASVSLAQAKVTAVGRPRATSAAKVGPERTARMAFGAAVSATVRRIADRTPPPKPRWLAAVTKIRVETLQR